MTKEEALKILRSEILEPYTGEYSSELKCIAIRRGIEALEQEPCEDCVSRKELMDNYNGVETPVGYRKVVDMEVIKNLQPVLPVQKWIPVSERLPLERNAVLVWSINNTYCAYLEDGKWYIFGAYDWELKEVVAWMQLPKPYKKEVEE